MVFFPIIQGSNQRGIYRHPSIFTQNFPVNLRRTRLKMGLLVQKDQRGLWEAALKKNHASLE